MFLEDDDIFGGTPSKKYFDILFVANRNLVEDNLTQRLNYTAALEMLVAKHYGEEEFEKITKTFIFENQDAIDQRTHNMMIEDMGDIASRNE